MAIKRETRRNSDRPGKINWNASLPRIVMKAEKDWETELWATDRQEVWAVPFVLDGRWEGLNYRTAQRTA